MKSVTVKSVYQHILNKCFNWEEDWERNWNAQPVAILFVGKPKPYGCTAGFNIQWSPKRRKLTIWSSDRLDQGSIVKTLSPASARRLTRLIRRRLASQQGN